MTLRDHVMKYGCHRGVGERVGSMDSFEVTCECGTWLPWVTAQDACVVLDMGLYVIEVLP